MSRLAVAARGATRNAGGPGRTRRSGAHLHGGLEPQPQGRHRAGARAVAATRSWRARGWWPKACARPKPRWRSAPATASNCRSPREMADVLAGRKAPQLAIRNLMGRKQKLEHAYAESVRQSAVMGLFDKLKQGLHGPRSNSTIVSTTSSASRIRLKRERASRRRHRGYARRNPADGRRRRGRGNGDRRRRSANARAAARVCESSSNKKCFGCSSNPP